MQKSILVVIMLFLCNAPELFAQDGTYRFLHIPANARMAGTGGMNVSLADEDINLFMFNPATGGDSLSGQASFNFFTYFAGVNQSSAAGAFELGRTGIWMVGVTHLALGTFDGYDDAGNDLGTFTSGETALVVGKAHQTGNFRMGANMKFVASNIAGFRSNALLFDIGGLFLHPEKNFTAGLVFQNLGFVLDDYDIDSQSKIPFDIKAGFTIKPEYMPFRFSITGHHLHRGDLANFSQTAPEARPAVVDRVMRHITIGTELLLTSNVELRFGYNHMMRRELRLDQIGGGAGITYGFLIKVKGFEVGYSRGGYHVAGAGNAFSVSTNINNFSKKDF